MSGTLFLIAGGSFVVCRAIYAEQFTTQRSKTEPSAVAPGLSQSKTPLLGDRPGATAPGSVACRGLRLNQTVVAVLAFVNHAEALGVGVTENQKLIGLT